MSIIEDLDRWALRGDFKTLEWHYDFVIMTKEKGTLWLMEIDFDEDGFRPLRIWTALDLGDKLEEGDLLSIDLYEKDTKRSVSNGFFKGNMQFLRDWFDEQVREKARTNPLMLRERGD